MNKFASLFSNFSPEVQGFLLSDNIRKRKMAANGIIMSLPNQSDLLSIIFFLQYDDDLDIATTAKKKFFNLPESAFHEALKGPLHLYVLAAIFYYITQTENQNLELFQQLLQHPTFQFNIIIPKLKKLSPELLEYLGEALSLISKSPKIMEALLSTTLSTAQKQKIIDFAIRNNINIDVQGFQKLKDNFNSTISSSEILDTEPVHAAPEEGIKQPSWAEILESVPEHIHKLLTHPKRLLMAKIRPLPPEDKVAFIYYLTLDPDEKIAASGRELFQKLPDQVIESALGSALSPLIFYGLLGILDGRKQKDQFFEQIIFHKQFDIKYLKGMIHTLDEHQLDLISNNINALIKYPQIIIEIIQAAAISPATQEKLLDFSARHNIDLSALKTFQERKDHIQGVQAPAEIPEKEVGKTPDEPQKLSKLDEIKRDREKIKVENEGDHPDHPKIKKNMIQLINEMGTSEKVKLALKGSMEARSILIKMSNRMIVEGVIRNPMISDLEVTKYSSDKNMAPEVIKYIAQNKKWLKKYTIKLNVVKHPKTPLGIAARLMETLRLADIKALSKGRDVPSAIRKKANNYLEREEKRKNARKKKK